MEIGNDLSVSDDSCVNEPSVIQSDRATPLLN